MGLAQKLTRPRRLRVQTKVFFNKNDAQRAEAVVQYEWYPSTRLLLCTYSTSQDALYKKYMVLHLVFICQLLWSTGTKSQLYVLLQKLWCNNKNSITEHRKHVKLWIHCFSHTPLKTSLYPVGMLRTGYRSSETKPEPHDRRAVCVARSYHSVLLRPRQAKVNVFLSFVCLSLECQDLWIMKNGSNIFFSDYGAKKFE